MVGSLGEAAINAVSVAGQLHGIAMGIAGIAVSGVGILAAQQVGARDHHGFLGTVLNGAYACLGLGLVASLCLVVGARPVVVAMIPDAATTIPLATDYLRIVMSGFAAALLGMLATSLLQAAGDTRSPMYASGAMLLLNTIGNYLLIFGFGPIPRLGVQGAAWATLASQCFGAVILLSLLGWKLRSEWRRLAPRDFRPHRRRLRRILAIGLPVTLDAIVWRGAIIAYSAILGRVGDLELAAYMISQIVRGLMFLPVVGIAQGCSIAVGQDLGADRPRRAQAMTALTLRLATIGNASMALGVAVCAPLLVGMFDVSPITRDLAIFCVQLAAILQLLETANGVLPFVLRGGGDARTVFAISSFTFWGVGIPISIFLSLALQWGLLGVLTGLSIEFSVKATLLLIRFRSGRWRRKLIDHADQDHRNDR
jgi:putative MATE family efflux protein